MPRDDSAEAFDRIVNEPKGLRGTDLNAARGLFELLADVVDPEGAETRAEERSTAEPEPTILGLDPRLIRIRIKQNQFKAIVLEYLENARAGLIERLSHESFSRLVGELNTHSVSVKGARAPYIYLFEALTKYKEWHDFLKKDPHFLKRLEATRDMFELVAQARETLQVGKGPTEPLPSETAVSPLTQWRDRLREATRIRETLCQGGQCSPDFEEKLPLVAAEDREGLVRLISHGLILLGSKDEREQARVGGGISHHLPAHLRPALYKELGLHADFTSPNCAVLKKLSGNRRSQIGD
jgi:hypothetical protein